MRLKCNGSSDIVSVTCKYFIEQKDNHTDRHTDRSRISDKQLPYGLQVKVRMDHTNLHNQILPLNMVNVCIFLGPISTKAGPLSN